MKLGHILSGIAASALESGGKALAEKVLEAASPPKEPPKYVPYSSQLIKDFIERHGEQSVLECQDDLRSLIKELRLDAYQEGYEDMRQRAQDLAQEFIDTHG